MAGAASVRRTPWRTRICDNAVRFWHRFVLPNRSRLERGKVTDVWKSSVAPTLDTYMGKTFESMARQAYTRYHEDWRLPGDSAWSRWEGQDRNRRSIELDIVASLDDGCTLLGEIKWSSRPVGPELHAQLLRNVEDLANSGHKWAHDASQPDAARYIYYSAAGFSEAFEGLARQDSRVRLVDLPDMFK